MTMQFIGAAAFGLEFALCSSVCGSVLQDRGAGGYAPTAGMHDNASH